MISKKTTIRIFKSNILSVLQYYAAESLIVTIGIYPMLEVFQNKCTRKILHIFWPNKITNAEPHERTGMLPISSEVKKRRWRWIGHDRMPPTSIPRVAMRWTPGGNLEAGTTKRDAEKVRGARDEGYRVELRQGRKACSGHNTMAFIGVGRMCEYARRGLSK